MLARIDPLAQALAVDHRVDFEFILHPPIIPKDTSRSIYRCRSVPKDGKCVNLRSRATRKGENVITGWSGVGRGQNGTSAGSMSISDLPFLRCRRNRRGPSIAGTL